MKHPIKSARKITRVVKHPELRKKELLDCAQELFFARGYENTTVNDVIDKAGVSKGAFYHYFDAKEELLEALAARFVRDSVAQVADILEDRSLGALGRLNAFLARFRRIRIEAAPNMRAAFDAVFRPENIVLYHRINTATMAVMTPVLTRIIAEGVEEGVFDTIDPLGTAEMLLQLGPASHDLVARAFNAATEKEKMDATKALENRPQLFSIVVNRILGLPEGSVQIAEPGYARAIVMTRPASSPSSSHRRISRSRAR
jgi:AcrR family transcriptional regulator